MCMELSEVKREFLLYGLFMVSDGHWDEREEEKLNDICRSIELTEADLDAVKKRCLKLEGKSNDESAELIRELEALHFEEAPLAVKERVLWNFLSIGLADGNLSKPEKAIIRYCAGKWNVPAAYLDEINDAAKTAAALLERKKQISAQAGEETKKASAKIDRNLEVVLQHVKNAIVGAAK